jgi:hypothetical protein
MELEALSEQTEIEYGFADNKPILWNGRIIQEESNPLLPNHSNPILLVMSRPPDRADAKGRGGYDVQRGPYFEIEGGVSWDLQPPPASKEPNRPESDRRACDSERGPNRPHDKNSKTIQSL